MLSDQLKELQVFIPDLDLLIEIATSITSGNSPFINAWQECTFYDSLSIAQNSFLYILGVENTSDEVAVQGLVKYLKVLDLLSVPVSLPASQMTAKQRIAYANSSGFLSELLNFKRMWISANNDRVPSNPDLN